MSPKGANSSTKAPGMKWQDCRSTVFDPQVLATAVLNGRLVQYCAPGAVAGQYQGDVLIVLGRSGQATKASAGIEVVHLAASDSGYDDFIGNQRTLGEGSQLYHFCSWSPCTAAGRKAAAAGNVDRCGCLRVEEAAKLPSARQAVRDYQLSVQP